MYCRKCGKELKAEWIKCPYCNEDIHRETFYKDEYEKKEQTEFLKQNTKQKSNTWKKVVGIPCGIIILLMIVMGPFTLSDAGTVIDRIVDIVQYYMFIALLYALPLLLLLNFKNVRDKLPLYNKHRIGTTLLAFLITYILIAICIATIASFFTLLHTQQYKMDIAKQRDIVVQEKNTTDIDEKAETKVGDKENTEKQVDEKSKTYNIDVSEYIFPDSDKQVVTDEEVSSLSEAKRQYAINEIYARHGRMFKDEAIQEYFNKKSWYKGTVTPEDFDENVFNEIEKQNIEMLKTNKQSQENIDAAGYELYNYDQAVENPEAYIGKKVWVEGKIDNNYGETLSMSYMQGQNTICTVSYDSSKITSMPSGKVHDAITIVRGTVSQVNTNSGAEIILDSICISVQGTSFPTTETQYVPVSSIAEIKSIYKDKLTLANVILEGTVRAVKEEERDADNEGSAAALDLNNGETIYISMNFHFSENMSYNDATLQSMMEKHIRIYGFNMKSNASVMTLGVMYIEPLQ